MKRIALIVPCYNEEANIVPFYEAAEAVFKTVEEAEFNIVFVNDGSTDKTLQAITALHEKDERVKFVSFSRNFGKEAALFAGVRFAAGGQGKDGCDAAIILDADLQHPVSIIPEMTERWRAGYDVVEGIKSSRGKEGLLHKGMAHLFYSTMSRAIGMDMEKSSDYKMLDRKVLLQLSALKERNTFFRALSFWCGYNKTTVQYDVQDRNAGASKWSGMALAKYAIHNVISFSYAPLNIVTVLGVIFLLLAAGVGIDAVVSYFRGKAAEGIPTVVILLLAGFGGVMVSMGIIGVYIAQIYDEVKGRPQYIIEAQSE